MAMATVAPCVHAGSSRDRSPTHPRIVRSQDDGGAKVDVQKIDKILAERALARASRDFAASDRMRDELGAMGVEVDDKANTWRSTGGEGGGGEARWKGRLAAAGHGYRRDDDGSSKVDEDRVNDMLAERVQAKLRHDFSTADRIRDQLHSMGIEVWDQERVWRAGAFIGGGRRDETRNGAAGPSPQARRDHPAGGGNEQSQRKEWRRAAGDAGNVDENKVQSLLDHFTRVTAAGLSDRAQTARRELWDLGVQIDDRSYVWQLKRAGDSSPRAPSGVRRASSGGSDAGRDDRNAAGPSPRVRDQPAADNGHSPRLVKRIKMPQRYHAMFSGRGGDAIMQHLSRLGVQLRLPGGHEESTAVRISGDADGVTAAKQYIIERLQKKREELAQNTPRSAHSRSRSRSRSRARGRGQSRGRSRSRSRGRGRGRSRSRSKSRSRSISRTHSRASDGASPRSAERPVFGRRGVGGPSPTDGNRDWRRQSGPSGARDSRRSRSRSRSRGRSRRGLKRSRSRSRSQDRARRRTDTSDRPRQHRSPSSERRSRRQRQRSPAAPYPHQPAHGGRQPEFHPGQFEPQHSTGPAAAEHGRHDALEPTHSWPPGAVHRSPTISRTSSYPSASPSSLQTAAAIAAANMMASAKRPQTDAAALPAQPQQPVMPPQQSWGSTQVVSTQATQAVQPTGAQQLTLSPESAQPAVGAVAQASSSFGVMPNPWHDAQPAPSLNKVSPVMSREERLQQIGSHIDAHVDEETRARVQGQHKSDHGDNADTSPRGQGLQHRPLKARFKPTAEQEAATIDLSVDEPGQDDLRNRDTRSLSSESDADDSLSDTDSDSDSDSSVSTNQGSDFENSDGEDEPAGEETESKSKRPAPWTAEEDAALCKIVARDGTKSREWDAKARELGTGRTGTAVSYRWYGRLSKTASPKDKKEKKEKKGKGKKGASNKFQVGERVKARWLGGKCWYPGKVSKVNASDDTRDIHYDDGEDEKRVKLKHIKLDEPKRPKAKAKKAKGKAKTRSTKGTPQRSSPKAAAKSEPEEPEDKGGDADAPSPSAGAAGTDPDASDPASPAAGGDDESEQQNDSSPAPMISADTKPSSADAAAGSPGTSPKSKLPAEDRAKVDNVVSITGCDADSAIHLLDRNNWDPEIAVAKWFDRPMRLHAGSGVAKYEPSNVAASQWSSQQLQPAATQLIRARASVFADRKKREQQGQTYEQMYPTRQVSESELQSLESHVPFTRATLPNREFKWVDTEAGEMPGPSDKVQERVPAIQTAWECASAEIQRRITRPKKKVVIGKLTSPDHPSVKFGGAAGAYALFAGEFIKRGTKIGYYTGHVVMSEEMDTDADARLDGRYAVDFPLPDSVEQANERDCLVIDASRDRNEMSFMNDFRDNAYAPPPKEGFRRGPNVELSPTWEDFRVGGVTYQWPVLLCEAICDIQKGRELIWD